MAYTFHSLRERLLVLALCALVPVLAVLVYTAAGQRQQATAEAERSIENLVRMAIREQHSLLSETHQLLRALSRLPALRADTPGCRAILEDLHRSHSYYTNLGVASPAGDIYCSAVPLSRPVNIADRTYFRRAVASGGLGMGNYQLGRVTGVHALNLGYPLLDDQGGSLGVVYAALNLSWLRDMVADLRLPSGATLTVIDSEGTIINHYPDPDRWVGVPLDPQSPLRSMIRGTPGTGEAVGVDGIRRLYAYAPLYDAVSGNAYVAVGVPKAVALEAANRTLSQGVAVLLLVALLTAAAVWFGSETFIGRPLRALARTAHKLAGGDFSARSGLAKGRDELAVLARDFDAMAGSLQRARRALETLSSGNRTLTRAVDEGDLLRQMCRCIVEVGGYAAAWVGYEEGGVLVPVAQAGFRDPLADAPRGLNPATLPEGNLLALAIESGQPAILRGCPAGDPRLAPGIDLAHDNASGVAFPLLSEGGRLGILAIYSREADAFDARETEVLDETAGDLAYGIAALRTREENERARRTIIEMASRDRLTGLPNHQSLEDALRREITSRGETEPLSVLFVGLDRFREINSALGFQQGDLLLQESARRLRETVGEGGFVARMRGDEFGVLVTGEDGLAMAERILTAFDEPFVSRDLTLSLSASVGIASWPAHGRDCDHLIHHADTAMRHAKLTRRRWAVYAATEAADGARRLALAADLKRAIAAGELSVHYQPKLDIRTLAVTGAEALVRWMHPVRGAVSPSEFIPVAEYTGLIGPLTEYVMAAALRQVKAWRERGLDLAIAVNLSARSLQDPDLVGRIEALLRAHGLPAACLELELTESAVMEDPGGALAVLEQLNSAGLKLYVDDFGTGYSSLAYLQRLPVDAMKIDQSFVTDMLNDPGLEAIVRSTIDLAHDLGLAVVAEGVESADVWDRLAELGCDTAQGYYIGRPMPPEEFDAWARRQPHAARRAAAGERRRARR